MKETLIMKDLIEKEIKELGVGSEEFLRHHEEILEMIENSAKGLAYNQGVSRKQC